MAGPGDRTFKHLNPAVYVPMQGLSELGARGKFLHWDRMADLPKIAVPTLMIGARYDTMVPESMEEMAHAGRYLYCPNGSPFALYDDQKVVSRAGEVPPRRGRRAVLSR